MPEGYTPRLLEKYRTEIRSNLRERFGYTNLHQIPTLSKIVLNMGVGEAAADSKKIRGPAEEMTLIAGQKSVVTRARKSIAGFKLREGMPVGCKVTLREARMYEFLDRLITIALPRVRDFRGLSLRGFDGSNNYAFGIREHIVFPEIDYDRVEKIRGMDIVVCGTAKSTEEMTALLRGFNFPLQISER